MSESRGFFRGFARWIDTLPGGVVFALALGMVALSGIVDELTGSEVPANAFYLLPVALGTWFLGAAGGLTLSLAAAVAAWAADRATRAYVPRTAVQAAAVVMTFAAFAVIALLVSGLRRHVERAAADARTDGLTGLLNRRGFLEVARREVARSARTRRPLTFALADLDRFKEVNHARGLEAGDRLLGILALGLRSSMRAVDACARLDGDEFALLLPEAEPASVQAVLDRLRAVLIQVAAEKGVSLTVSVGAVTYAHTAATLDERLRAADAVLREVKAAGGNAVRHVTRDVEPPLEGSGPG